MSFSFACTAPTASGFRNKVDRSEASSPLGGGQNKKHVLKEEEKVEFIEVIEAGKGASFGELALMTRRPRAATVIAKTD